MEYTNTKYFVIDFDSTFTKVEALDVLGEIALEGKADKTERLKEIKEITDEGMNGSLTFRESLVKRLEILDAHQKHLPKLIDELKKQVSKSFQRNKEFFENYKDRIFIISNGFKDFIVPIVNEYHIKTENVYANSFEFDTSGNITGFDQNNALSINGGKRPTTLRRA